MTWIRSKLCRGVEMGRINNSFKSAYIIESSRFNLSYHIWPLTSCLRSIPEGQRMNCLFRNVLNLLHSCIILYNKLSMVPIKWWSQKGNSNVKVKLWTDLYELQNIDSMLFMSSSHFHLIQWLVILMRDYTMAGT